MVESATRWHKATAVGCSQPKLVANGQRGMVGKFFAFVDAAAARQGGQGGGGQVVVDAPAHVVGIGLTPVAPPGVARVGGGGFQAAVHVVQATGAGMVGQQLVHPGALFGGKAAVFLIAAPVFDVVFGVGDVDVAAEDEVALLFELHQVLVHGFQKAKLGRLAFFARRSAGKVAADDGQLALRAVKARLDVAAFGVELGVAKAVNDIARGYTAVDAYAGVAFFLGAVEPAGQLGQGVKAPGDVGVLGLEFLHANTIWPVFCKPRLQPLGGGRADTVQVQAGKLK